MSTTLASGANTTITLPAGQVLYTGKTGSGTAVIGPGPQANQTFTLGTGARIGPYNNDVSVFLTSFAGTIDYQVGAAPGVPPGNPISLDPLGPSLSGDAAGAVASVAGGLRGKQILTGALNGTSSAWERISASPERFGFSLDSGTNNTGFLFDLSEDGTNVSASSFSGTTASTTLEVTPPVTFFDPLAPAVTANAKYFRVRVVSGTGAISMYRGV